MAATMKTVALFGGTFDPVHTGHLTIAKELKQVLNADELRLIPCAVPPHRPQPHATPTQRLAMLQLALRDNNDLTVDARELQREGPSYTVDTVNSLRQDFGEQCSLILCMGTDAFCKLDSWHQWQDLMALCHIVVAQRPDYSLALNPDLQSFLEQHQINQTEKLNSQPCGAIFLAKLSEIPVSSTAVREALGAGNLDPDALPLSVSHYIKEKHLYRDS